MTITVLETVLLGLIIGLGGFLLAMMLRNRERMKEISLSKKVLTAIVLLFFCVQVVYNFRSDADRQEALDCQYRVNAAIITVLNDRSVSTTTSDIAMRDMAQAILDAKSTDETRAAIRTFIDAVNAKVKVREDNPLPSIPNDCKP